MSCSVAAAQRQSCQLSAAGMISTIMARVAKGNIHASVKALHINLQLHKQQQAHKIRGLSLMRATISRMAKWESAQVVRCWKVRMMNTHAKGENSKLSKSQNKLTTRQEECRVLQSKLDILQAQLATALSNSDAISVLKQVCSIDSKAKILKSIVQHLIRQECNRAVGCWILNQMCCNNDLFRLQQYTAAQNLTFVMGQDKAKIQLLQQNLEQTEKKAEDLQAELKTAQHELGLLLTNFGDLSSVRSELASTQAQNSNLKEELSAFEFALMKSEIGAAQHESNCVKQQLHYASLEQILVAAQEGLQMSQGDLGALKRELESSKQESAQLRAQLVEGDKAHDRAAMKFSLAVARAEGAAATQELVDQSRSQELSFLKQEVSFYQYTHSC